MYLSRLRLNPLSRDVRRDIKDVRHLHKTIMSAFPDSEGSVSPRNLFRVLHRLEYSRITGWQLLVQSQEPANWGILPYGYLGEAPGVKSITEAYSSIKPGNIFSFRLRANPTRKIAKAGPEGEKRNGMRVPHTRTEDQIQWLLRKSSSHGFALQQVLIAATGSSELVGSQLGNLCFQGVMYEGTLVVVDLSVFLETLASGIGSGKAFGFGLLSLAPLQKSN